MNELAEEMRKLCVEFAAKIGRAVNVPAAAHGPARAGDLRSNLVLNTRAREVLGWQPTVDLKAGLRQTVEWFARQ